MTATHAETNPTSAETSPRSSRATGYCRVALPILARGTLDDARVHLVVPVEDVTAVDVRTRSGGRLSISVAGGSSEMQTVAWDVVEALANEHGLTGEVRVAIRPPSGPVHPQALEAVAAATVDALSQAVEVSLTAQTRAALVARLVPESIGLTYGCPALVGDDTRARHRVLEHGRVLLVSVTPGAAAEPSAQMGTPIAPPEDGDGPTSFTRWLQGCAGRGTSRVRSLLAGLAPEGAVVLGGYSETAPVVVILPHGSQELLQAQALAVAARKSLAGTPGESWRVSTVRTAAHSAVR